jgi:hypothetical protein
MGFNGLSTLLAMYLLLDLHHLSTAGRTPSTLERLKFHEVKGSYS